MITREEQILRTQLARVPKPKKEQKGPQRRADKLKEAFKGYKRQLKIFLSNPDNLWCKIKAPGCKGMATCVHHTAGRTGEQLKNEADWMPACESCNVWVEENDSEAREKGFKKTRLGKVNKKTK